MTALDKYLAGVKARAAAATPGPWRWNGTIAVWSGEKPRAEGNRFICSTLPRKDRLTPPASYEERDANALFIAAARTDVDRLVAMVEELKRQRDQYRDAFIVHAEISHQRADEMEAGDNAKLDRLAGEAAP